MQRRSYQLNQAEKKQIIDIIISILKEKNVVFTYLHGSFLKETFRDVDLAIYLKKHLKKKEALYFELEMERELEKAVSFPVDLRILNNAPLSFKYKVFKEGKLLFSEDELLRSDFISLTLTMYYDLNFHRKRYMKEALGLEI